MKLFLAGCDTPVSAAPGVIAGGGCFLSSYFHGVKDGAPKTLTDFATFYHHLRCLGAEWIMDSGLFTMMFGAGKGKTYTKADLLAYTDRYIADMHTMDFRHTIVEMDVHKILGMEHVQDFRDKFEKDWSVERTMFVWHLEEKVEGLRTLAKRYPYIALSVPELRRAASTVGPLIPCVKKLVGVALAANPKVKIHLLGCTQSRAMQLPGVYSCDSSSWLQASVYRWTTTHKDGRVRNIDCRSPHTVQIADKYRDLVFTRHAALLRATGLEFKMNAQFLNRTLCALAYLQLNRWVRSRYYSNAPLPTITGLTPLPDLHEERRLLAR